MRRIFLNNQPDQYYDRSRDELRPYEDSEFFLLSRNIPNYYISCTDQTIWGSMLRDVAAELGRLEYFHSYDLVGKNPQVLTPADIKRQWADPLFLNRHYPQPDQYDLDYQTMLVKLIKAYREGATTQCIQDVIQAYTGQAITVEELWKSIGKYYDATVRNMLRVMVRVDSTKSSLVNLVSSDAININRLKTITDDLYGAIDLAKPAHVGCDLTIVFGLGETFNEIKQDALRIFVLLEERPAEDPLYQAPFLDLTHPDTGLASTEAYVPLHKVFNPSTNPAPAPADPTKGYTVEEFNRYAASATPGSIQEVGNPEPHPGLVSPILNRAWEIKQDRLDTFDMD